MDASPNRDNFQEKLMKKIDTLQNYMEENFLHLNYNMELLKLRQEQQNVKIVSGITANCQLSLSKNLVKEKYEKDMSAVHKEVLKENLENMVKDIDLENSDLLDDLQTGECLTSDEAAEVIRKPLRRDQVRKLVLHIGRKSSKRFTTFLEKLQKRSNYPHLAQNLMDSYNRKTNEISNATQMSRCLVCVLKQDVLVKDVIDKLYSNSLISPEIYELSIENGEINNATIWETILIDLKRCRDQRKARQVLQEALAKKYEHIAATINKIRFPDIMCRCRNLASNLFVQGSLGSDSTGSLGDISTTSELKLDGKTIYGHFHHKRSVSSRSETSENSTQFDFTNIPSTVAWLVSIPNGICEPENDRHDRFSSDVLMQLEDHVNEFDSVSKTGALHDSDDIEEMSVVTDKHDTTITFNEPGNENEVHASYASVVSGKCFAAKLVPRELHADANANTTIKYDRMISTSSVSSCLSNDKRNSVESLSEIGTLYLSKSQTTHQAKNLRLENQAVRSQSIKQTNKQRARPKLLTKPNVVVNEKSLETRSCTNSSILEKVFFEEQKKIHGDLPAPENATNITIFSNSEEKKTYKKADVVRKEKTTMETGQHSSSQKPDSQFKDAHTKRKNKKRRKSGK